MCRNNSIGFLLRKLKYRGDWFPTEIFSYFLFLLLTSVFVGAFTFDVKKVLGEGSYARIFSLVNSAKGDAVVAKYQKPPFPWEFYITREIQSRINDKKLVS